MAALNAGRPPKPAALKQLEGTARKDRSNAHAPAGAPLETLPMPEGLTEREARGWAELAAVVAPMRVVTASDLPAFRQMVTTWALIEGCRETVNALGVTFTVSTESGEVIRKRPEVEVLLSAKKQLSVELAQFGLTPAARQRVSAFAPESEGHDPLKEFEA